MKDKKDNKKQENKKEIIFMIISMIIIVALAGFIFYKVNGEKTEKEEKDIAFTKLIEDVNEGKIEKIELKTGSNSISVVYKGEKEEIKTKNPKWLQIKEIDLNPDIEVSKKRKCK